MRNYITCTMCGQLFDPSEAAACQACPLKRGCQLVRCPACGFEMVDPGQSSLARFAKRLLRMGEASDLTSMVEGKR